MADNETTAEEISGDYTTETPSAVATETKAPRAPLTVSGAAVGRRKQAIARVRLTPGTGTGTATVATGTVDQPPAAGLSPTSWARVAHRQRCTGCLLQRSFGAAFFLALHNPALWPASVAGALPRRLVCDRP